MVLRNVHEERTFVTSDNFWFMLHSVQWNIF